MKRNENIEELKICGICCFYLLSLIFKVAYTSLKACCQRTGTDPATWKQKSAINMVVRAMPL